ncbi:hypothetical protein E2C01_045733 [Portunus trituberculatus]|uniref:Uncharacterized protein n=1 Tax=Portunus trituberculatus TaxID=210409 RepID=A0A5B7G260_PORTR|nr:hypothetical protein [Portunus trituberculatus]
MDQETDRQGKLRPSSELRRTTQDEHPASLDITESYIDSSTGTRNLWSFVGCSGEVHREARILKRFALPPSILSKGSS